VADADVAAGVGVPVVVAVAAVVLVAPGTVGGGVTGFGMVEASDGRTVNPGLRATGDAFTADVAVGGVVFDEAEMPADGVRGNSGNSGVGTRPPPGVTGSAGSGDGG
jgi:hypothetical protein